jgi:peptide/nickel transport system ATP-binding protein
VTIAMALACGPDLLIADEPTTALDVTVQRQILDLIRELVAERRMALMLISHDLGVIAQNVQRVLVMYGGAVVESGPTAVGVRQSHAPVHAGIVRRAAGGAHGEGAAAGDDPGDGAGAGRSAERVSVRGALPVHDRRMPCGVSAGVRGGRGAQGEMHTAGCGGGEHPHPGPPPEGREEQ